MTHAAHVNKFAHFARVFIRSSERASSSGAVPASFVAPVWGIFFCDCGESVIARTTVCPYDGDYSAVVVAIAAAGVCF